MSGGHDQQAAEALRLIKGTPDATSGMIAHRLGVEPEEGRRIVQRLEQDGLVRHDGDRLVVVEPAASQADPDRPIP